MPRCVKCGTQIEEGNKFCTQCGQPVTESIKVLYCEKCGMQLEEDKKFCTQCGQPVTEGIEAEQPVSEGIEMDQPVPESMEIEQSVSESVETEQPVPEGVEMTYSVSDKASIEQPKEKELQGRSEVEEELYLGGLASADIHPKGRGTKFFIGGCGLYATNKRIIILRSKKGFVKLVGIVSPVAGLVGSHANKSDKTIAELEEEKEFEMKKEDIAKIELQKKGWLIFTLNSGEINNFIISDKRVYRVLFDLMKLFYPERSKLEEWPR